MRGEGFTSGIPSDAAEGSPPRAWGRGHQSQRKLWSERFTPTCVGKGQRRPGHLAGPGVHPHVRGEGVIGYVSSANAGGSPPRAWGRGPSSRRRPAGRRFTPTCVGKGHHPPSPAPRCSVHPHVRGEGRGCPVRAECLDGSPPRAWGRGYRCSHHPGSSRFTPTCVGKGPRRRHHAEPGSGSPPRAWGRGWDLAHGQRLARFTPTCVGKGPRRCSTSTRTRVHPHVRGEGSCTANATTAAVWFTPTCVGKGRRGGGAKRRASGSPPRAWGRGHGHLERHRSLRFTPTCVGKGTPGVTPDAPTAVHPHVRGEGSAGEEIGDGSFGSPPRAWGRAAILPGRALTREVHPHVRGEGRSAPTPPACRRGSPPRAWGRAHRVRLATSIPRFTPTCVGKGPRRTVGHRHQAVHPHVRGEGDGAQGVTTTWVGSPPRAWGRVREKHIVALVSGSPPRAWGRGPTAPPWCSCSRFTPTCVGKGPKRSGSRRPRSVHPHVRGEGTVGRLAGAMTRGSPPRAWGRVQAGAPGPATGRFTPTCVGKGSLDDPPRRHPRRFTPTCVGKGDPAQCVQIAWTVHPHVRGEGVRRLIVSTLTRGSPPRAWGREGQPVHDPPPWRFTPTCVGKGPHDFTSSSMWTVHPHVRGEGTSPSR